MSNCCLCIYLLHVQCGRSRDALKLPSSAEIAQRAARGVAPLTRPELAVLSGNVKLVLFTALVSACKGGRAGEMSSFDQHLRSYFPKTIQERFPDDIGTHLLADEIAMTVVVTRICGDAGVAFVPAALAMAGGADIFDVVSAYLEAQQFTGLDDASVRAAYARDPAAWLLLETATRRAALCALSGRGSMVVATLQSDFATVVNALRTCDGYDVTPEDKNERALATASYTALAFTILKPWAAQQATCGLEQLTRRYVAGACKIHNRLIEMVLPYTY